MAAIIDSAKKFDAQKALLIAVTVLAVSLYLALITIFGVTFIIGPLALRFYPPGTPAVPEGPRLSSVTSLPVNTSGEGTIRGIPTGAATSYGNKGSFVLVLDPAPAGLPARTTLSVYFDHSTKAYSGTRLLGDPLAGMDTMPGPNEADPTGAVAVTVHFHIKNGQVFAERLDLSNGSFLGHRF